MMWVPIWIMVGIALMFAIIAAVAVYALMRLWAIDGLLEIERAKAAADRAIGWGVGA
jgi:hypothetical protein